MSIKDDLHEQHLLATDTCFICHASLNENNQCPICENPDTYQDEQDEQDKQERGAKHGY